MGMPCLKNIIHCFVGSVQKCTLWAASHEVLQSSTVYLTLFSVFIIMGHCYGKCIFPSSHKI